MQECLCFLRNNADISVDFKLNAMEFNRTPVKTLPNGEASRTYPFHISTKGQEDRVVFRDEEDLRVGHNLMPICARRANVILFMDCEIPTHMHAGVLAKSYEDAREFGDSYKISYSKYFTRKYGNNAAVFRHVESLPSYLEDNRHLRNTICYIARNALDVGARVEEYPWSGYRSLFCGGKTGCLTVPVASLKVLEAREILKTGDDVRDTGWLINMDNAIEPVSYCDWRYAESAFSNDVKFFMKIMGLTDDNQMEQEMEYDRKYMKSTADLLVAIDARSQLRYGRELSRLTDAEKIPLIKIIYYSHRTTVAQLARCFGVKRDFVEKVLKP